MTTEFRSGGRTFGKTAALAAATDEFHLHVGPPACRWMDDRAVAAWFVRWMSGRTLLDEILPLVQRGTMWAGVPADRIGDAFLSIVRDWLGFPVHTSVALAVRLERLNAQIEEEQRQAAIERSAATAEPQRPTSRPTRKGKGKPRPKAGRR